MALNCVGTEVFPMQYLLYDPLLGDFVSDCVIETVAGMLLIG